MQVLNSFFIFKFKSFSQASTFFLAENLVRFNNGVAEFKNIVMNKLSNSNANQHLPAVFVTPHLSSNNIIILDFSLLETLCNVDHFLFLACNLCRFFRLIIIILVVNFNTVFVIHMFVVTLAFLDSI